MPSGGPESENIANATIMENTEPGERAELQTEYVIRDAQPENA